MDRFSSSMSAFWALLSLVFLALSACYQSNVGHFHMDVTGQETYDFLLEPDAPDAIDAAADDWISPDDPSEEVIPDKTWIVSIRAEVDIRALSIIEAGPAGYVASGINDGWIIKLDEDGTLLWSKVMESEWFNKLQASTYAPDGTIYAAGMIARNAVEDLWLMKLGSGGDIIWQFAADYGDRESATSLDACADGGLVAGGYSMDDEYNTLIMKISPEGSCQWSKLIEMERPYASTSGWGGKIIECRDGSIAMARGIITTRGLPLPLWILKLGSDGTLLWQRIVEGHWNGWANDIIETRDGSLLMVGGQNFLPPGYDYNVWILSMSPDGELLWQRTYGGPADDWAISAVEADDGGFFVGGMTESFGHASSDMWLLRFDAAGNLLWQESIGGGGWEEAWSMTRTTDGHLLLAGENRGDSHEAWIVKTDENGEIGGDCPLLENLPANSYEVDVTVTEPVTMITDGCPYTNIAVAEAVDGGFVSSYLCP